MKTKLILLICSLQFALGHLAQAQPTNPVVPQIRGIITDTNNALIRESTNLFRANAALLAEALPGVALSNVLYVAVNGDDSTGMRGRADKPFETFRTANSNALSGDLIQFLAGNFFQTNTIHLKEGVSVRGKGEATVISATNGFAITVTNSNHSFSDFKIDGFQGIGVLLSTQSITATNIILRNITMKLSGPDALSFWSSEVTNKHRVEMDCHNVTVASDDVTDFLLDFVGTTNSLIRLFNCPIIGGDSAILVNSGRVEVYNGYFEGRQFAVVTDGGEFFGTGGKFRSGLGVNLFNASGTLEIFGSDYQSSDGIIGTTLFLPLHTPASSSETNVVGAICWDGDYIYVWTATNVNKRAALTTW